jgi:lipid-A-disaccharide synthase-like uncharacterized protein
LTTTEKIWIGIGFFGQFMFTMRFVWQWISSESVKKSVIPVAFWYFSVAGGSILLTYAIHKRDPVFIVGQASGLFIYLRNLWLIRNEKAQTAAEARTPEAKLP